MHKNFTFDHTLLLPTRHPTWSSSWERSGIADVHAHRLDVIFVVDWFSQFKQRNIDARQIAEYNPINAHRCLKNFKTVHNLWAYKHSPLTDIWIGTIRGEKSCIVENKLDQ